MDSETIVNAIAILIFFGHVVVELTPDWNETDGIAFADRIFQVNGQHMTGDQIPSYQDWVCGIL